MYDASLTRDADSMCRTSRRVSWAAVRAGAAAVALLLAACAGVPSQEMSDARRALDAAREAHAQQHARASYERAASALEDATQALGAARYEDARQQAEAARKEAILSRELATRVAEVVSAIDAVRAAGGPWQGAESLLREAEATSRAGDTARAAQIAARALTLLR
jgi:hypothetical protein